MAGAYRLSRFIRPGGLSRAAFLSCLPALAVCCAGAALSAGRAGQFGFLILYCLWAWALFWVSRHAFGAYVRRRRARGEHLVYCIILGSYEQASRMAAFFRDRPHLGIAVSGILTGDSRDIGKSCAGGAQVIGTMSDLGQAVRTRIVDWAVLADEAEGAPDTRSVERQCRIEGVGFAAPARLYRGRGELISTEQAEGICLIQSRPFAHLPVQRFLKRAVDCAAASAVVLCCLPLWIIVPIAIKLTSPGPVFFVQERVGRNGRRFKMYKFRSMVDGAEQMQEKLQHLNEMEGPVFKIKNDPRFSSIGGFLRKTSIDELPQLFNVIRGNMSLVGPRPPLLSEVVQYQTGHRKRLCVIPGMTCLWQITGRNEIKFKEWMLLDAEYIDSWSLMLDIKILVGTVRAVLLGQGAH
jgi:exopolysaccharide biosynthesis polyprenyl glycosylphosphotransferase